MWPVNAETAPRDDNRADVEPTVDDKGADGLIMDDPRDADEWMPDEAGYGYGV